MARWGDAPTTTNNDQWTERRPSPGHGSQLSLEPALGELGSHAVALHRLGNLLQASHLRLCWG